MKINEKKVGIVLSYVFTLVSAIVAFVYIPLLIHFLGKEEYGLYQLIGTLLIYMALFDFGLSNTVTRYYSKYIALGDEKKKENLLALSCIIYSIITILILIIGYIIYLYLDNIFSKSLTISEIEIAKKMFIILLFNIAITVPSYIFDAVINSNEKFVFIKSLSIVMTLIRPFIVFAIFSIESSALILVVIQTVINLTGILIKIIYCFCKIKVKIKFHFWDINLLREMIKYSFFIFLAALMDQIFWRSDQLLLGILIGTSAVAVYSLASQIIMNYMSLSLAMSGVFLPSITKRVINNESDEGLTKTFIRIGRLQYIILACVIIGFALFGREFIFLWVGNEFESAYYITLIIMIPFTIDLIQNIGLTILQAKNLYSFRAIVFFFIAILNVILSIPLILKFGGIGAAIATSVSFLIGNGLIMNVYYYRKVKIDVIKFWREIFNLSLPIIFVVVLGYLINLLPFDSSLFPFLIKLFIYIFIYSLIIYTIGLNKYEKGLISSLMKTITVSLKKLIKK